MLPLACMFHCRPDRAETGRAGTRSGDAIQGPARVTRAVAAHLGEDARGRPGTGRRHMEQGAWTRATPGPHPLLSSGNI
jgi:hypothetical protein